MKFRSFIAVDLSPDIRKGLERTQRSLKRVDAKVNWIEPHNLHLTLKYCDNLDAQELIHVTQAMEEVFQGSGDVELFVTGIGTFPDLEAKPDAAPRVIWAGVEVDPSFVERARRLEIELMEAVGIRPEARPWTPHVTIGRVKTTQGLDSLKAELVKHRYVEFGECRVSKIVLYHSTLTSDGPVYSCMSSVPL